MTTDTPTEIKNLGPIEPGTVLFCVGDVEQSAALHQAIQRIVGHNDFLVIFGNRQNDLSKLDPDQMREKGWVRADDA